MEKDIINHETILLYFYWSVQEVCNDVNLCFLRCTLIYM